jgi:hypothetical protein
LVSGFLVGFFSAGVHAKYTFERIFSGGPPAAQEVIVKRLTRELDLSESQRAHVESVVTRTQAELFKLRQQHQPEVRALIDSSIVEMKQQLSPEQCQKLDRHFEMVRQRWWGWRGHPGGRQGHQGPPDRQGHQGPPDRDRPGECGGMRDQ